MACSALLSAWKRSPRQWVGAGAISPGRPGSHLRSRKLKAAVIQFPRFDVHIPGTRDFRLSDVGRYRGSATNGGNAVRSATTDTAGLTISPLGGSCSPNFSARASGPFFSRQNLKRDRFRIAPGPALSPTRGEGVRIGIRTALLAAPELVPRRGLEPPRPFDHQHLKLACLPISPPGLRLRVRAFAGRDQRGRATLTAAPATVNEPGSAAPARAGGNQASLAHGKSRPCPICDKTG